MVPVKVAAIGKIPKKFRKQTKKTGGSRKVCNRPDYNTTKISWNTLEPWANEITCCASDINERH